MCAGQNDSREMTGFVEMKDNRCPKTTSVCTEGNPAEETNTTVGTSSSVSAACESVANVECTCTAICSPLPDPEGPYIF